MKSNLGLHTISKYETETASISVVCRGFTQAMIEFALVALSLPKVR